MGIKTRKLGNISDQLVQWQAVHTADASNPLAVVAGRGYFINTTSAVQTVTLPGSPVIGDTIMIVDYASTFNTNNVTLDPGSNKIEGSTDDGILTTNDQTHTLVFTDSTQGWKIFNQDTAASIQPTFVAATGGTVTTSGNYKIHTFTGDSNFVVSSVGNPAGGPNAVSYMVVAGGGATPGRASGTGIGGGAGAGGYREGKDSPDPYTASPLNAGSGITVTAQTYPITVGGGGSAGAGPSGGPTNGTAGSNSVFSTITSAGGGRGGRYDPDKNGGNGGSGGGSINGGTGGSGNTPPVSPSQGNNGGAGFSPTTANGGGGGGATGTGGDGSPSSTKGGNGGAGATSSITGSPVTRAGGGAGAIAKGAGSNPATSSGGGGSGGFGPAPSPTAGTAGTANTGGGAGGDTDNDYVGKAGGKGIVIIRYKFQ